MNHKIFSILENVFKIVSDIAFLFLISYGLVCVPMLFGYKFFVSLSDDTNLSIDRGTLLYYEKANTKQLKEEDIVVKKIADNNYEIYGIDHIVYNTEEGHQEEVHYFATDEQADEFNNSLKPDEITGKVAKVRVPYVGHYVLFVNKNKFLVYLSLIVIAIDWILGSIANSLKNNKRRVISR